MTDPVAPLRDLVQRVDSWNLRAAQAAELFIERTGIIETGIALGLGDRQLRAMMPLDRLKAPANGAGEAEQAETGSLPLQPAGTSEDRS